MESERNEKKFVEPEFRIIRIAETDIITTSGDPIDDCEGEIIPVKVDNLFG